MIVQLGPRRKGIKMGVSVWTNNMFRIKLKNETSNKWSYTTENVQYTWQSRNFETRKLRLEHLPADFLHDKLVYPPKIYSPTFAIVIVGPFSSHREWNWFLSRDALQQSFQSFSLLLGFNQLVKLAKYSEFFPTMTELFKPVTKVDKTKTTPQNLFNKKRSLDAGAD